MRMETSQHAARDDVSLDSVRELDEAAMRQEAEQQYGPPHDGEGSTLEERIARLSRLLLELNQYGPEHWTDRQRQTFQWYPEEVLDKERIMPVLAEGTAQRRRDDRERF